MNQFRLLRDLDNQQLWIMEKYLTSDGWRQRLIATYNNDEADARADIERRKEATSQTEAIVATHVTEYNLSERGYYSPTCSCGWKGGCWNAYENARNEIVGHLTAIRVHVAPFNQRKGK